MKYPTARALIFLNPSLRDENTHCWYWKSDSGYILVRSVVNEMQKLADLHFSIFVPQEFDGAKEFVDPSKIDFIPYNYPKSAVETRFDYNSHKIKKAFKILDNDVDFVWSMLPELLGGFNATLNNRMRQDAILFGYFNWLDSPKNKFRTTPSFIENQMSGIVNSHFFGVNSQAMLDELIQSAGHLSNFNMMEMIRDKGKIMYPGTVYRESAKDFDPSLIAFPHRLNRFTNLNGLLEYVNDAFPDSKDFKIWVTDTSNKKRIEKPWLLWKNISDYNAYMDKISKINFGISTHIIYSMWAMAVIDMLSFGKPVLLPDNIPAFHEMMYEGYPFFYKDKHEFATKFKELLNRDFADERKKIHQHVHSKFSWKNFAEKILDNFTQQFSEPKFLAKTPDWCLKNLTELLEKHKAISKRELFTKNISSLGSRVSFSYPYARRNLLLKDGIFDDTTRSEVVYYVGDRPKILPTFDKVTIRKEDASRFRIAEREVSSTKTNTLDAWN